jgi:hypothetical protein
MKPFCLAFLVFLFCNEAFAKDNFEISVPVAVEDENAVTAKDKAMQQAQRVAFMEAAVKLAGENKRAVLENLSDDEILHFVQAVGVDDEKAGGTKYSANLTVKINESLLKAYLAENDMYKGETVELLVIPIYRGAGFNEPQLWESGNGWLKSWRDKGLIKFGTMQIKTAGDNYKNVANLNAENALYMGADLYNRLVDFSQNERIYVVYAETLPNNDLKVTVKNEKDKSEDSFSVYKDEEDNIFDKAIEKSVMFIANMERNADNRAGVETTGTINVVYLYQDMKDWLQKSKAISGLPQVDGIDTKSLGGGKVNFVIKYSGTLENLWMNMQELGLSHESVDNYFIIR